MKKSYRGSCHCGAVRFECETDLAVETSRCNCSVCSKGRFWKAIVMPDTFRIVEGEDALSDYQFGGHNIHHRFCRTCGTKPFGKGRIPELGDFYAINVACLDDASDAELAEAKITFQNGRQDDWEHAPAETRYL